MSELTVDYFKRCMCGAITITFEGGREISMKPATLKKHFPELVGKHSEGGRYGNCNHCVNHWGVDLCECGSGKDPKKCCGTPYQEMP